MNINKLDLEILDIMARFEVDQLRRSVTKFASVKLFFPEDKFNRTLQGQFKSIERIALKVENIIALKSGSGVVAAYKLLASSYQSLISKIDNFTPPNKPKEYVTSFKKSMNSITSSLKVKLNEYIRFTKSEIRKNDILSEDNNWFLLENNLDLGIKYWDIRKGIMMDRGAK